MLIKNGDYPIDESKDIVRYMNFTKFADILLSKSIFFVKAGKLSDQYEFNLTEIHKEQILTQFAKLYNEEKAQETLKVFQNTMENHRQKYYVSCWSEYDEESYALWKIYLNGQDGVSIRTDFNSLKKAFDANKEFYEIGKVEYTDKLSKYLNPNLTFKKRKYYQYENEVRLAYYSADLDLKVIDDYNLINRPASPEEFEELHSKGFKQKLDLKTLIKEIRISPFSNITFERLVVELLEQVEPELVKKVVKSEIRDK